MNIQKGDILLYKNPKTFFEHAIIFGEDLHDGIHTSQYYHVAIAISPTEKVEANGRDVAVSEILLDPREFDVFRLPLSQGSIDASVSYILEFVGEHYDWTLIADDVLRYATFDVVHLPKSVIRHTESTEKICSTLAQLYLLKRGVYSNESYEDPEEVYLSIKDVAVKNPQ